GALAVDRLVEVALAVEQAHGDERDRHVARGLAVVAGEDAEAAGVDRQALMETEFGAEVGDQLALAQPRSAVPGAHAAVVGVVGGKGAVVVVEEDRVVGGLLEPALVHAAQERLGVVLDGVPQAGVEAGEKGPGGAVPG